MGSGGILSFQRAIILAALFAVLGAMTLTDWGAWAAIIAAIVAVSLVIFGIIKSLRERHIRHILATYLSNGQKLSEIISVSMPNQQKQLEDEMNCWISRVAAYLKRNRGIDYETLFLGSEGLVSHWQEMHGDMRDVMLPFLDIKLQRLHELVK